MRYLISTLIFCLFIIVCGCSKNETTHEIIKVKKNDSGSEKESQAGSKDSLENNSHDRNVVLPVITSSEVKKHIGDSLKINGNISDVYKSDKVAYLNFENKFPKSIFSCVIFSSSFEEFGDLSSYKGRDVIVTGRITIYKDKPQIILKFKDQIKISK